MTTTVKPEAIIIGFRYDGTKSVQLKGRVRMFLGCLLGRQNTDGNDFVAAFPTLDAAEQFLDRFVEDREPIGVHWFSEGALTI